LMRTRLQPVRASARNVTVAMRIGGLLRVKDGTPAGLLRPKWCEL
jgi:hypothetical protein